MSENFTNTELLIQYMDGDLKGRDLDELEKRLVEDKSLQEELQDLRLARDVVKSFALNNHINDIHRQIMPELQANKKQGIVRKLARNTLRVAASVIILLSAIGVYQYATVTPDRLFADNYEPYIIRANRGDQGTSSLEIVYKNNQFIQAIEIFKGLKDPTSNEYFLAGNAYLHENMASEAIQCFSALLRKNESLGTDDFQDNAEYFLAMTYLKNKEVGKALPYFEKIHADKNHLYNDKVSKWFLRKMHWLKRRKS